MEWFNILKGEWVSEPRKPVVTMIKKIEAYLKRNPQGMTFNSIVKDNYSENPVIKRHLKTLKSKGKVVKVKHVRRGKKGAVIETKVWKWIGE